jgi:hypothetical protein
METNTIEEFGGKSVATREYDIRGIKYIVKATVRDGANQDATAIVRRLIQKDIHGVK